MRHSEPSDALYHKGFTKCRTLAIGKDCEYNHGEVWRERNEQGPFSGRVGGMGV